MWCIESYYQFTSNMRNSTAKINVANIFSQMHGIVRSVKKQQLFLTQSLRELRINAKNICILLEYSHY